MKKRVTRLVQVCLLIAALVIPTHMAYAYFTDYESAAGGATVGFTIETHTNEVVDEDGNKTITILNTGTAGAVVRVAIFGTNMTVTPSDDWTKGGDGFYYYNSILEPKAETSSIRVDVKNVTEYGFDIVVVHESAIAVWSYDAGTDTNTVNIPEGWEGPEISVPVVE